MSGDTGAGTRIQTLNSIGSIGGSKSSKNSYVFVENITTVQLYNIKIESKGTQCSTSTQNDKYLEN